MPIRLAAIAVFGMLACPGIALASAGPVWTPAIVPIAAPRDRAYPGEIRLSVDVSDPERRIVHVRESLSGVDASTVLLYPKWLPGNHGPLGPIDRLAGLKITANGTAVRWARDPVDVYAFHMLLAPGDRSIDIEFDYLSPTSARVGELEISREIAMLEWNTVVLYPAGYYARRIPVDASITLPAEWKWGSALEQQSMNAGRTTFKRVDLETLVDSPVYAGRYTARLDLDPGAAAPVHLDVFADRPDLLTMSAQQLEAHRALVQQTYRLFRSRHYAHYDFLYSLSDQVQQKGLEHLESSENGSDPGAFIEWDRMAFRRSLLPHELSHSWNGKFRRPVDLWTPNYNVPMQDSLLWMYEGQTQYWGEVLAARSGLWTKQQALDQLALTSAYYDVETGDHWRTLQDTTNDPIINPPRRPMPWRDWQRFEDYYAEGQLIWLDVDTLIRERSQGKRSLDDFAKAFFGIEDGSSYTVTYTFADVVAALGAVEPYDWATFLRERLDAIAKPAPLDGLRRGGYKLIYTDEPSDFQRTGDEKRKHLNLIFSIGAEIDNKDGSVVISMWDSPAFKAKLTEGAQILSVNGAAYSAEGLKDAILESKSNPAPIQLILKTGERYLVISLDYHGGPRYPHLERDASQPARLDDILAARK
jgi:predicted metalloprotease with PDZ domain